MSQPQLLVSVRSPDEARAAIDGGCDVLDIKEPAQGSLGMAAVETMTAIVRSANAGESPHPVSAALGEIVDWLPDNAVPSLPAGLQFVKLGTAGLNGLPDWQSAWMTVRRRFSENAAGPLRWIAVAYADYQRAESPPAEAVITAAAKTGCAGVLFDTFHKDGRTLFDELLPTRLSRLINEIRERGMIAALAGSLKLADLPRAVALQPEIIAVRSAACAEGKRMAAICPNAVRRLRETIVDSANCEHRRPVHSAG